ncbi:MAG: hypothetical protein FJ189_10795, partial [Gammaproteobacteria bacterium]|nr:hypothetical protein [Gammaproteobacteria bacterium]
MRALLAALLITYMLAPAASAVVIGHAEVDAVASLPQATMDKIGGLEWFFSHASVGTDMLSGMAA